MLAVAVGEGQAQGRGAAQAVQGRAECLAIVPQHRGVKRAVLAVDSPAQVLFVEQGDGDTGNLKVLGDALQVVLHHFRQPGQAAHAQAFADLGAEQLVLLAGFGVLAVADQVADVQQLQNPAVAAGLDPATGLQGAPGEAIEIQVEVLALPIGGAALDHHGAVGTQVVHQRFGMLLGGVFDQAMTQRTVGLQDAAEVVQVNLQTGVDGDVRRGQV